MPLQIPKAGVIIMQKVLRVIKLHTEYRQGKYDRMPRKIPVLKLSGEWLHESGFHPGKVIHVYVEDNCLVVQAVES